MSTAVDTGFVPVEVAFRLIGESFKRREFRTQRALDAWLDRVAGDVAEIRLRELDG